MTARARAAAQTALQLYRAELRLSPANRNYAHQAARLASALQKLLDEPVYSPAPLHDSEGITGMHWDNLGSGGAA